MLTKTRLIEKIRRRLGHPMVKVEVDDKQISDHIDYARSKYIKWAVGNATHEVFFTVMLSGGQYLYDMPSGVTELISYSVNQTGNVNALFTLENQLMMSGVLDPLVATGEGYNLISYHIARDFLDTLRRYTPEVYNYKYHPYMNQLEIQPVPLTGNQLTWTSDGTTYGPFDSPGFVLIQASMITSSGLDTYDDNDNTNDLYSKGWVLDYCTCLTKLSLGMIRRKFASFTSGGNDGIALDGDSLISEAKEEKEGLEEALRNEETYTGWGFLIG